MVIEKLEAYWSPEQIAGRLLADGVSLVRICKETIYRFIYGSAICPSFSIPHRNPRASAAQRVTKRPTNCHVVQLAALVKDFKRSCCGTT
jgi:IS30 family transposase